MNFIQKQKSHGWIEKDECKEWTARIRIKTNKKIPHIHLPNQSSSFSMKVTR